MLIAFGLLITLEDLVNCVIASIRIDIGIPSTTIQIMYLTRVSGFLLCFLVSLFVSFHLLDVASNCLNVRLIA